MEPDSSPWEPEEVPKAKIADTDSEAPQIPTKLENPSPNNSKGLEYSKTIDKLKKELEQKNLIIAEKDKQLRNKDIKISLLTTENKKLKAINQEKDRQLLSFDETLNKVELEKDRKLKELQEKVKQLTNKNIFLIENSTSLKNAVKNLRKIKEKQRLENKIFLLDNLSEAKKPQNNLLVEKEKPQTELQAQIQVWKPPN